MDTFTRRPVPPLPDRALVSTDTLYEWAQPIMLRTWSTPYWNQGALLLPDHVRVGLDSPILVHSVLLPVLQGGTYRGQQSLHDSSATHGSVLDLPPRLRAARVILVPKSTDATILFGACFIIVDAAYRFKTIQWFKGPTYEPMKNFMLFEGLRLYPALLTGWVHLCASSLVFPLRMEKLRPLWWHLGLFGVPILCLATFVPAMILGDREAERGQAIYLALERELLAAPGAPLTQWMKDQALLSHAVSHFQRLDYLQFRMLADASAPTLACG